ncbi:MAG: hypothetical protein JW768_02055 [Chitinispirillaceae bacterium]|nr:hypothetical protein [Chitinispirillaceae bacterium]
MIRTCDELYQKSIRAVDGELGKLFDLYFDDRSWHIRYLVVELGSWFTTKRVLISPLALAEFDGVSLNVQLTKQEIADCPSSGLDKPVYMQEKERAEALYTMVQSFSTTGGLGMVLPFVPPAYGNELEISNRWNRHLRSSRIVSRYTLCQDDGKGGSVKGFLVDDRTWIIRYLVFVPAAASPPAERLLETGLVDSIEWAVESLHLHSLLGHLKDRPAFDRQRHVNIPYEELLVSLRPSPDKQETG